MFTRLRRVLAALLSMPSQLSTLRTLVEHSNRQQQETNDLLRELTVGLAGRLPTTPPTPLLVLPPEAATAPSTTPETPPKPRSRRLRTDADVVVVTRESMLDDQLEQHVRVAQALRANQRIV
jgi:hypothetical protein